ncbi:MAG: Rossmann-like and DUF2520 domain-containing protein [Candidatus Acidiferrum sp.]
MHGSLSIIGAGRVGRTLARRLHKLGWSIEAVVARSEVSARKAVRWIGAGKPYALISRRVLAAHVILIATPDSAIELVARELARIGGEELSGKVVLHTSGALDACVLDIVRLHGAKVGSMHPLQSFSGVGLAPLEGKVFAIEGDPGAVRVARQLARVLGGSPVQITGSKKARYHAAATLAAGQILAVQEAATRLLMSAGMNRREAMRALLPLTRQVLDDFERLGARAAWTGPLERRDFGVVATHINAMREMPQEFAAAYVALNKLAAIVLSTDSAAILDELGQIFKTNKSIAKASGAIS